MPKNRHARKRDYWAPCQDPYRVGSQQASAEATTRLGILHRHYGYVSKG
jgi:hypothetical protein